MTEPLLSAEKISVLLGGRPVLQNVSLSLQAGEIVSLIGPNGAGKTTLLRALLGLVMVDSGHVSRAAGLRLGYVPQKLSIDPLLPLTTLSFLRLWPGASEQRMTDCLTLTGAAHLADRPLQKLSGGEYQRVLLARALLGQPNLLVLDEPAQALDVHGQASLYDLIGELVRTTGCGVLMVSHDLHIVMRQTSRVICLNQHVCCEGHPGEVGRDPAYTALFGSDARSFALYQHHHDHHHG